MSTRMNFRSRKVDVKKPLPLIRREDAPDIEIVTSQRNVVQIETGVEKEEEEEHHLQAAIKAAQAAYTGGHVESNYIPTPDASVMTNDYSKYYQPDFNQSSIYIKYNDHYDNSVGINYCMDEEDYAFIRNLTDQTVKKINEARFEEILKALEDALLDGRIDPKSEKVEVPEDILTTLKTNFSRSKSIEKQFKAILQHWVKRREKMENNETIMPRLRLDRNLKAETDPYLCFRRREIKLQRRTRATDGYYINRLNHLRCNLMQMADIIDSCIAREEKREELIQLNEQLVKNRISVYRKRVSIKFDGQVAKPEPIKKHEKIHTPSIGLNNDYFESRIGYRIRQRKVDKLKNKNSEGYTDITDMPYQPPHVPKPQSLFTYIPNFIKARSTHQGTAFRRRVGRGGRIFIDRTNIMPKKDTRDKDVNNNDTWIDCNIPIVEENGFDSIQRLDANLPFNNLQANILNSPQSESLSITQEKNFNDLEKDVNVQPYGNCKKDTITKPNKLLKLKF